LKVVSFSTILTEIAQKIGGDHVQVASLVKAGVDPHEFQPAPSDLSRVGDAQLVLTSGKNLENYVPKLQEATGGKADLLKVGDHFPSMEMKPDEDEKSPGKGTGTLIEDPHWWHSIANVKMATRIIRDELIKLDASHKAQYDQNASAYLESLGSLEHWVKTKIAELPRDKRKLVTSHDAFQYFARDYGFKIYAIEGISTDVEPSNRHVTELIDRIKAQNVKAIFLESALNPKVTREITRETGATIGGTLYADGLGEGDAATFEGMMKHNVTLIVDSLK
jgi:ABC-type Zn uptake system ZnuABC Zn-binding protein ZnuA